MNMGIMSLVLVGAVLFLLGYFFPVLNRIIPEKLRNTWFMTYLNRWAFIPATSIRRFVQASEWVSNRLSATVSNSFVVVFVIMAAVWSAGMLMPNSDAAPSFLERVLSFHAYGLAIHGEMVVSGLVAVLALLIIKLKQPAVSDVIKVIKLVSRRARLRVWVRQLMLDRIRLERAQESIEDNESFSEFVKGSIEDIDGDIENAEKNIEDIEKNIEVINDEDTSSKAMGGMFVIFLVSSIASVVYVYVISRTIGPVLSAVLFQSGPIAALQSVLFLMPSVIIIFIFIQFLIPTAAVLMDPNKLFKFDPKKPVSDPLEQSTSFLFLLGASMSLIMTYGAFILGHTIAPDSYIPQTFQMVLSNAVFDGLTFAVTLFLMKRVDRYQGWWALLAVLVLMFLDLIVAGALGILSIYFGLLGGEHALSLTECTRILLGQSYGSDSAVFGPLFWVMHTAFLPTVVYLIFMLFFILAKLVMSLVVVMTHNAAERGLMATGGMLTALSSIAQASLFFAQTVK